MSVRNFYFLQVIEMLFEGVEPWKLIVATAIVVHISHHIFYSLQSFSIKKFKAGFFSLLRRIPMVQRKIQEEVGKAVTDLEVDINAQIEGREYYCSLPELGWSKDKVLTEIDSYMSLGAFKAENGSLSGTCHKPPDSSRVDVVVEAFGRTAFANPLNPDAFPGIRKMEAEVVRMTCTLFNGDPNSSCGTMTSGGTESLILACKAYRDFGLKTKGIRKPNIVMSITGHVGIDKAAELLGMEVRHVPIDVKTMQPDMNKFKAAIDKNTCMLVASTPQYPHGVIDPVKKISALAIQKNVPLHIDACLGGFLIAFAEKSGMKNLEPFDFRVEGVTSISADTHKFGYAPKGSSVIMYREKKFIHCQYYVSADWTGGIFASPTLAGSRSGGIIAATWAALMNFGLDGYVQMTKDIFATLAFIVQGIRKIEGLRVMGDPHVCIVAFTSDVFSIYSLADKMKEEGWLLACLQYPTCIHLYITPMHTKAGIKEKFVADLTEVANLMIKSPTTKDEGRAAIYGMAQKLPDRNLVKELAESFIDALYTTKS